MPSPSLAFDALWGKLLPAIAAAAMLGGGTMVLRGAQDNAVQAEQIQQQQLITTAVLLKMDNLVTEVNETNKKLERIAGRMEANNER